MGATFEERLKQLRKTYVENPKEGDKKAAEAKAFMALPKEEKISKIEEMLIALAAKKELFQEKLEQAKLDNADQNELEDLTHTLENLTEKKQLMMQKLEYVKKDEYNAGKMERIKRQLADLELKRCKLRLSNKDCSKLDKKIQEKKKLFSGNRT